MGGEHLMSVRSRSVRHALAGTFLGIALITAACGGTTATASPTVAPTTAPTAPPVASASPVASPSVAPSTSPAASAAVDPAAGLKIAAPYTITELDPTLSQSIAASMEQSLGAFSSLIHVGARSITNAGTQAAILMVIAFPAGTLSDTTYQSVLTGMTASTEATLTTTNISGIDVSTGKLATTAVGVFRVEDHVLLVLCPDATQVVPVVTALIAANQ
jgi:hypothetical protein